LSIGARDWDLDGEQRRLLGPAAGESTATNGHRAKRKNERTSLTNRSGCSGGAGSGKPVEHQVVEQLVAGEHILG
jgi:hypothetical protein